ncbi:MAG: hypothetical protein J7496_01945 [Novosphingobium sp.]|nr:hypothetical protein [Novosphingobium sp.]
MGQLSTTGALDRQALIDAAETYLDALAANNVAQVPFALAARFTENSQELEIGDGFWATCSGRGVYKQFAADPVTQQVGFIGVMRESGREVIFGLRLRIEDGLVSEAETVVSRDPILFYKDGPAKLEARGEPMPLWRERVPESERANRAELAATADAYFEALQLNDGTKVPPIAAECDRMDNGVMATHAPEFDEPGDPPFYALGPAEQLATGYFGFVTRIRDRRYPIIDEEFGVVFSLSFLDHSGAVREIALTDGRTVPIGVDRPFAWQIMEVFKITGGLIRQIEVLLNLSFYGMRPNWPATAV